MSTISGGEHESLPKLKHENLLPTYSSTIYCRRRTTGTCSTVPGTVATTLQYP